jgi:hypothetical protein
VVRCKAENFLLSKFPPYETTTIASGLYVLFGSTQAKSEGVQECSGKFASIATYISIVSLLKIVS